MPLYALSCFILRTTLLGWYHYHDPFLQEPGNRHSVAVGWSSLPVGITFRWSETRITTMWPRAGEHGLTQTHHCVSQCQHWWALHEEHHFLMPTPINPGQCCWWRRGRTSIKAPPEALRKPDSSPSEQKSNQQVF